MVLLSESDIERFWSKVDRTGECWIWTRATLKSGGYGAISVRREGKSVVVRAHVASWEIAYGPIPAGLCVCHNCPGGDNPACVNPAHLWLGTRGANNADTTAKGRHAHTLPNSGQLQPGVYHRGALLTAEQVREIRRKHVPYKVTYRHLAEEYGVSEGAIHDIVVGRTWAHLH